ncbi:fumarylacetoacetate hydrolase family protein [Microbacterium sp. SORGH_AS_0862]|uniref:fumarylacetoacetate hydrolase family protein n=1 Tax=Microbacterium sp. SORGH_AS_0862 TaxID=3041789 RepID=UPI0027902C8F|nr:fumarylacetoacetate hydrolase family protein [Microbacterium sp. SORGH_AS_0862]MDQ1204815.1 2-keto-4-pentenoate hydratase/2-oxohepta-3-ene-1,7-dioic acid hydratase in catechol pathway [Microbacterium sp. SORGH_AS_0862]
MVQYARFVGPNGILHTGRVQHGALQDIPGDPTVLDLLSMPAQRRRDLDVRAGRQQKLPVGRAQYTVPVEPRAIRDFVTFEAHIAGMKKAEEGRAVPPQWYEAPAFVFMNPWSVVPTGAEIPMPSQTEQLDFELEVAMVVKHTVRDVSLEEAPQHIAGFCIMNDWSARDVQRGEMAVGLGPSKGKDFATTIGPWLTTPDELERYREGDRYALEMSVAVNGETVGTDNLRNMSWSFEELLVHASRDAWVGAGDILATGTASQGALAERWARAGGDLVIPPLQVGDVVTMTVEGLGTIENRIGASTSPGHRAGRARRTYGSDRL